MARKASKEDSRPNDPETIFRKHMGYIEPALKAFEDAKDAQKKASGTYRNALGAAKKEGVDIDALLDVLEMRRLDIEDVNRHNANVNQYARWLNIPLGFQLGLGLDGRSVATQIEDAQLAAQAEERGEKHPSKSMVLVQSDGFDAFNNNLSVDDNPYPSDTIAGQKWISGFRLAEEQGIGKARRARTEDEEKAADESPRSEGFGAGTPSGDEASVAGDPGKGLRSGGIGWAARHRAGAGST